MSGVLHALAAIGEAMVGTVLAVMLVVVVAARARKWLTRRMLARSK